MQLARHPETAEKKQPEGPESMPLLSKMPSISGLATLTLEQIGSERLAKNEESGYRKRLVKGDLLLSGGGSLLPVLIDA